MSHRPLSRRSFIRDSGKMMALGSAIGIFPFVQSCGGSSGSGPAPPPDSTYTGTDDQLMDEVEYAAFLFFWEQANPQTGLIKDRANASGTDSYTVSSIASVGFGLTALCIGDSRSYMPSATIRDRVQLTLETLLNAAEGNQGFFYHFLDLATAKRAWTSELSNIDSAILLCGVLTARQHYRSDSQIPSLASQIYERVNWQWMLDNTTDTLSLGWTPESGFQNGHWDHYCELMMMYLLGLGSPTYPLPQTSWSAWSRPVFTYNGVSYISAGDPLFTHQFSHAWFDFRNKHDAFADYFQNSVRATAAHKAFCLSLAAQFPTYGDNLWGITASDSTRGYVAWGGPPGLGPIDGTVVPCASGGSLPFLYTDCMKVLRNIRGKYGARAWGKYGFIDSFNPGSGWTNRDVIGIDVGITMLMVENYRTQFIWNTFMANPEIQAAMQIAGFQPNP
jgi:hypothetical protein